MGDINRKYNMSNCKNSCSKQCGIFSLTPQQFSILSSLIGILIANYLTADQQNSLGNFLVNIGQAIFTVTAQEQLHSSSSQNGNMSQQIQRLKAQIEALEKEIES